MGLKKVEDKILGLNHIMKFGRCKGSTIREIIDDGQCSYIQFLINEQLLELDNEAYNYLRIDGCCGNVCNQCKDIL